MNAELEKIKKVEMLFILGKGRSGTSLLQNMLDAHPAVIGPPESKFMLIFYPCFAHIKKWKEQDILHFVDMLYTEALFTNVWKINRKELTEKLVSIKDEATYGLLCKTVYYQMNKGKDNLLLISDKNPQYTLFIDTILKIFPDAKFIHIVREPRDNIYSHIKSFHEKNTIFRAYQWVAFNKIIEDYKRVMPQRYFSIIYENFVRNPEIVMKELCTFLNIQFVPEIAQNKPPAELTTHALEGEFAEKARTIHKELLQPVNTSNIGKWKQGLSEYDKAVTEIITSEYARKIYGYDIEIAPSGRFMVPGSKLIWGKWLYATWQAFTRWRYKNYSINLLYSKIKKSILKDKVPMWEYF